MPNDFILSCYLIMLLICIDQGDGRWKKTDGKELHRDIEIFEKVAEHIESEIDEYYEDYQEPEYEEDKSNTLHYKQYLANSILRRKNSEKKKNHSKKTPQDNTANTIKYNISNHVSFGRISTVALKNNEPHSNKRQVVPKNNWPKFEEILLEIGKQYDWKNDRWIKVKRKSNMAQENGNTYLHEKHNFRYRTVKLNRSKSRRNVVIAVTSVR